MGQIVRLNKFINGEKLMKKPFQLLLLLVLLAYAGALFSAVSPSMRVKQTVDDILRVIQDRELSKFQKRDMVKGLVRTRFDYRAMSQLVLAKNWKLANDEQKSRFIDLFRELLERTYYTAMDSYDGQAIRLGKERQKGNRAVVQTFITHQNQDIPVNYSLRFKNNDWYAYDVKVDGISLVSNYRTSFHDLIREQGVEGLLQNLQKKVDSLEQQESKEQ
jgi:phospholipid transport system substrate-binding protein